MCAADVHDEPVDGLNDECEAAAGAAGLDCGAETVFPVLAGGADGIRYPQAVSLAGYRGICGPDARVGPLRGSVNLAKQLADTSVRERVTDGHPLVQVLAERQAGPLARVITGEGFHASHADAGPVRRSHCSATDS